MSKVFVLPKSSGTPSLSCVTLKHPKDGSECMFYYRQNSPTIYELNIQKNRFYSWFVNDALVKDGNLYLLTPIDPLFLLIPLIYENTGKFRNLSDIFVDNNIAISHIELLQSLFPENVLKCISDVKTFEDDTFIKFNKERTLKWLRLKFESIKKSLAANGIGKNLFGFKVSDYDSGDSKLSEDEYKVLAYEMIVDYVCKDLGLELRDKLGIPDENAIHEAIQDSNKLSNKRKLESDHKTANGDARNPTEAQVSKESNKKPKMTRAQIALSKSNKVGMKSITSYFVKK